MYERGAEAPLFHDGLKVSLHFSQRRREVGHPSFRENLKSKSTAASKTAGGGARSTQQLGLREDDSASRLLRGYDGGFFLRELGEEEVDEGAGFGAAGGASVGEADEEDEGFEDVGFAEGGDARVLEFGFAKFL